MRCVFLVRSEEGRGKVIGPSHCCSGKSAAFAKYETTFILTCSTVTSYPLSQHAAALYLGKNTLVLLSAQMVNHGFLFHFQSYAMSDFTARLVHTPTTQIHHPNSFKPLPHKWVAPLSLTVQQITSLIYSLCPTAEEEIQSLHLNVNSQYCYRSTKCWLELLFQFKIKFEVFTQVPNFIFSGMKTSSIFPLNHQWFPERAEALQQQMRLEQTLMIENVKIQLEI